MIREWNNPTPLLKEWTHWRTPTHPVLEGCDKALAEFETEWTRVLHPKVYIGRLDALAWWMAARGLTTPR
jgi:hypothetical protein